MTEKDVKNNFITTAEILGENVSASIVDLTALANSYHIEHFLTKKERETYQFFSHSKRKLHWLGGRIAAKKAIIHSMGKQLRWQDISIGSLESGRPTAEVEGTHFKADISISHSETLACAMTVAEGHCGIDIQVVDSKINRVESRFCTEQEISLLQQSVQGSIEEILTLLWATKESIRKVADSKKMLGFLETTLTGILKKDEWYTLAFDFSGQPEKIISLASHYKGYGLALTCTS